MLGTAIGGGKLISINNALASGSRRALIMSNEDQSPGIVWINGIGQSTLIGATADGSIGDGIANTNAMINSIDSGTCAASVCTGYSVVVGGITYSDWYLPCKSELNQAFISGGLGGYSWSSTEDDPHNAWVQNGIDSQLSAVKTGSSGEVRAVRAITY